MCQRLRGLPSRLFNRNISKNRCLTPLQGFFSEESLRLSVRVHGRSELTAFACAIVEVDPSRDALSTSIRKTARTTTCDRSLTCDWALRTVLHNVPPPRPCLEFNPAVWRATTTPVGPGSCGFRPDFFASCQRATLTLVRRSLVRLCNFADLALDVQRARNQLGDALLRGTDRDVEKLKAAPLRITALTHIRSRPL